MNNKQKGNWGEEQACQYLQRLGQKIIKRQFKRNGGEVDIISEEETTLIFTEVKSFRTLGLEELEYAVSKLKQRRIIHTALQFMAENPSYDNYIVRFDVVFLSGRTGELHHLTNAFEGDGAP